METELLCPVCHAYFKEPVMLQCTHHICMAHLANITNHERLACPRCQDVTIVPEGGLPVDRTLQVVVELWLQNKVAQQDGDKYERSQPLCGFCEEQPASRRCVQCSGVLCEDCERTSHSKGFFRSHTIVDIDSASTEIDYNDRMRCDEHPEEKLSFYCLDCRKPVCSHCLILGEHKGHQQTPIDQAFETGKETLGAWVDKLSQRIASTEELIECLRGAELDVNRGAEAQRNTINHEMDHLRELIETKRHQLLSKSALEEKQKRVMLQAQVDRADQSRQEASMLVLRSQDLLAMTSEHVFLAVVLPLIQDMKKCASQPVESTPQVSCTFRPLSTDPQVRSLGELDLGIPRLAQQAPGALVQGQAADALGHSYAGAMAMAGPLGASAAQGQVLEGGYVLPQGYNIASTTMPFLPQGPMPVQQVQYVYGAAAVRPSVRAGV